MSEVVVVPPSGAPDVAGRRVLVYSLGMEGRDLASWLLGHGARVTVSDTRSSAQLEASGAIVAAGVERVLTGAPLLDPEGFALVAVSQSILRHDAAIQRAATLGIPVISQMQLFLRLCPGRVVGITGSSGKTTTTALVGAMAREAGVEHVVGGNIGEALLGRLPDIKPSTTVILEISHTQLQYTDRSPAIAAVTNVTPNHLDQFSWEEYAALKQRLLAFQGAGDIAVLNADDAESMARLKPCGRAETWLASIAGPVARHGAWLEEGVISVRTPAREERVLARGDIRLRGEHNVSNVVMACAVGAAAAFPAAAMRDAVRAFTGVPHRLETVGTAGGATWVNDSIATSPERTMAGLRAFLEPVVLLLGGRDKRLPMDGLRNLCRQRCRAVVCFGEAGEVFCDAVSTAVADCERVRSLEEAVAVAARKAQPGDVVLLSPAGTSFDAYPSFEQRGEEFRALVAALPGFQGVAQ